MPKKKQTSKLVSAEQFERAVTKVLSVSKEESDKQLAEFQAANVQKREQRSRKKP